MRIHRSFRHQQGVALAVALILLAVLTLLALAGIRMSTLELRIALNEELRVTAYQQAQSLVDYTIRDFTNTPIVSQGVVICARNVTGCTDTRASLLEPDYASDLSSGYINVAIRRITPLNAEPPVGTGFSLANFDAAFLRVEGQYDKTSLGQGAAQVNEGIAVVFGSAGEITFESEAGTF